MQVRRANRYLVTKYFDLLAARHRFVSTMSAVENRARPPGPQRPARGGTGRVRSSSAVHPRACGERVAGPSGRLLYDGSSPRVRGTPEPILLQLGPVRFIPARAGNAARSCRYRRNISVHPRACGERSGAMDYVGGMGGSSPRVRGTPCPALQRALRMRFIPARAGNAVAGTLRVSNTAVHPRACGERPCAETQWQAPNLRQARRLR